MSYFKSNFGSSNKSIIFYKGHIQLCYVFWHSPLTVELCEFLELRAISLKTLVGQHTVVVFIISNKSQNASFP